MDTLTNYLEKSEFESAIDEVSNLLKPTTDVTTKLRISKHLAQIPSEYYTKKGFSHKKIAILTGYTSEWISALLRIDLFQCGIYAEIFESGFGRFEQVIHSKDNLLKTFSPNLVFLCVGSDHLDLSDIPQEAIRWKNLWLEIRSFLSCDIIQNTFEEPSFRIYGHYEIKQKESLTNIIQKLNADLSEHAPSYVHFHDVNFLSSYYGRSNWRDESLYHRSKIPVAYNHLPAYSSSLASVCAAVFGKTHKCLVLDLDNTLWGGVVADDGVEGIEIGKNSALGEAYLSFQTYLKALKSRGVILAACSKNNEKIAKEVFLKREDMALRLSDFSAFICNFDPKDINIRRISETLNIGIESMVFVDDNPAERELVRSGLPNIKVLELPSDPAFYASTLNQASFFETISLTDEDRNKSFQYEANEKRKALEVDTQSYPSFLRKLDMKVVISEFDELNMPRIVQLINKTNQFNLTTRRYTNAQITNFLNEKGFFSRFVKLKDKFGDNGLISAVMGKIDSQGTLVLDTWLMSCRVLKRNVEVHLFKHILQEAMKMGLKSITAQYIPTEKNDLVSTLPKELGFSLINKDISGVSWWEYDLIDREHLKLLVESDTFIKEVTVSEY